MVRSAEMYLEAVGSVTAAGKESLGFRDCSPVLVVALEQLQPQNLAATAESSAHAAQGALSGPRKGSVDVTLHHCAKVARSAYVLRSFPGNLVYPDFPVGSMSPWKQALENRYGVLERQVGDYSDLLEYQGQCPPTARIEPAIRR